MEFAAGNRLDADHVAAAAALSDVEDPLQLGHDGFGAGTGDMEDAHRLIGEPVLVEGARGFDGRAPLGGGALDDDGVAAAVLSHHARAGDEILHQRNDGLGGDVAQFERGDAVAGFDVRPRIELGDADGLGSGHQPQTVLLAHHCDARTAQGRFEHRQDLVGCQRASGDDGDLARHARIDGIADVQDFAEDCARSGRHIGILEADLELLALKAADGAAFGGRQLPVATVIDVSTGCARPSAAKSGEETTAGARSRLQIGLRGATERVRPSGLFEVVGGGAGGKRGARCDQQQAKKKPKTGQASTLLLETHTPPLPAPPVQPRRKN